MSKVHSPCVNLCIVNYNQCVGCYRTLHEIAEWSRMSDDERQAVLDEIEERKRDN